jgi:2,5-furandicarboxylate decarboxylase 1
MGGSFQRRPQKIELRTTIIKGENQGSSWEVQKMIDMNGFLEAHRDEIIRVKKPVKLDHVGALIAQAGNTIVFENITGYPGFRLADQFFVNRKAQARILGCEPKDVVKRLAEVMRNGPKPLKEVQGAPCQDRVFVGDDVDLTKLPVVRHTALDPYPYSTGFAVHKDPETGQYNAMFPRCGVLGPKEMVASFVTPTANKLLGKYKARGEKMPQAIAIGTHPAWELAAVYSHPHEGWWELELFETITGHPGEVTRCKTVDLMVPADASIVIEGFVDPTRMAADGPNPGPNMIYCPYQMQMPVFEVSAITVRQDPVYRHHQVTPFTDHQEMPRIFHEAIIFERLQAMGLETHDVYFPNGGAAQVVILQVEPSMDGQVTDALLAALWGPWANIKMAIAVNPDIDIYDYRDVMYALATRVDPSKHVTIIPNARIWPFDPSATPVQGAFPHTAETRLPSVVGKWAIDATKAVPYRPQERRNYERAWPIGWGEVRLEDYL